jgi:raffinose/stachyose/melibiose transport system substrate-binding protein
MGQIKFSKAPLLGVLAVVLLALVAGLGVANAAPKASITLRFAGQAGQAQATWQALAKNFEAANPGVHVQVDFVPVATYAQTLLTQFQAGNAPDVFYGNGGSGQPYSVDPLQEAGRIADLTGLPFAKRIPPAAHNLYYVGKKLYGLPLAQVPVGVIYNLDLFKSMGVKIPKTFSQLISVCKTAKAQGKVAFNLAGAVYPNTGILLQIIASDYVYASDPSWDQKRKAGKVAFSSSAGWKATLQRITDMNDAGCFQPGVAAGSAPQLFGALASGQAMMGAGPASVITTAQAINKDANLGLFPFPGATPKSTRATFAYSDALLVNKSSSVLATAKKFVTFIAREGQSRLYAKAVNAISLHDANTGTHIPPAITPFVPYAKAKQTAPLANLDWVGATYPTFATDVTGLLTGQKTIDQILADADAAWNKGQ